MMSPFCLAMATGNLPRARRSPPDGLIRDLSALPISMVTDTLIYLSPINFKMMAAWKTSSSYGEMGEGILGHLARSQQEWLLVYSPLGISTQMGSWMWRLLISSLTACHSCWGAESYSLRFSQHLPLRHITLGNLM